LQQQGGLPGEFSDWSVSWNKNVDPRAFTADMLEGDKLSKLMSSLKGTDKQRFLDSLRIAINTGVVDPSKLPGAKVGANAQ
jgi:hypothetical protein